MVDNVTSEDGERSVGYDGIDGIVHAPFEAKWHIAHVIAIWASRKIGVSWLLVLGIRPAVQLVTHTL